MRRALPTILMTIALVTIAATAGCTKKIFADNARSSAASFLTGVFSSAVNAAVNTSD